MCTVIPRRQVAVARRPPLSTHTHTPTPTLGCILRMRAYVRTHTHALLRPHICTHTGTQSCTSGARAPTTRPTHASAHRRGRCERGGGGHSQSLEARPVGRRRQRRELGVVRQPARQPCGRAGRLWPTANARRSGRARQPCARGARPTADDRQRRRRRIQRRVMRPQRPARQRHAHCRHRRERARRRRRRAWDAQAL